jgi:hypothetical protein
MNWRVKFRLFQVATYGIVFTTIALMAVVTGKYIETIGLFVSFASLRYAFEKTWHSKSFWRCIFISCIVFVVGISFVPNKGVSILACIAFGLCIDYVAYKYKDYEDIRFELHKPFNVDTCTRAELLTRCREIGLSEENTELAIDFFITKTKKRIIADRLCVTEEAIHKRKLRLRKKLNK